MIEPERLPTDAAAVGRLGGGRSARVAGVGVAVVLAVVTWMGVSGRPTPRSAPQTTAPAIAVDFPSPSPSPAATASPEDEAPPPTSLVIVRTEIFGAYVELADRQFITILDEELFDRFTGTLTLPVPVRSTDGVFALEQFAPASEFGLTIPIGKWPIALTRRGRSPSGNELLVNEVVPAKPEAELEPRPVQRGYQVVVTAVDDSPGTISITIVFGAAADPLVRVSHPLERGSDNSCRWDLSGSSLPPRPGTDREDC